MIIEIERVIEAFNAHAGTLYDDASHAAGGIAAEDRHGMRFLPFTILSIGVVRIRDGGFRTAELFASAAAAAKHGAMLANVGLYVGQGESISRSGPRLIRCKREARHHATTSPRRLCLPRRASTW